jgi:hypothetical protein
MEVSQREVSSQLINQSAIKQQINRQTASSSTKRLTFVLSASIVNQSVSQQNSAVFSLLFAHSPY